MKSSALRATSCSSRDCIASRSCSCLPRRRHGATRTPALPCSWSPSARSARRRPCALRLPLADLALLADVVEDHRRSTAPAARLPEARLHAPTSCASRDTSSPLARSSLCSAVWRSPSSRSATRPLGRLPLLGREAACWRRNLASPRCTAARSSASRSAAASPSARSCPQLLALRMAASSARGSGARPDPLAEAAAAAFAASAALRSAAAAAFAVSRSLQRLHLAPRRAQLRVAPLDPHVLLGDAAHRVGRRRRRRRLRRLRVGALLRRDELGAQLLRRRRALLPRLLQRPVLAQPAELGARAVELRAEPLGLRLARGEARPRAPPPCPRGSAPMAAPRAPPRTRLLRPRREPRLWASSRRASASWIASAASTCWRARREHLALEAELLARGAQRLLALRQAHRHARCSSRSASRGRRAAGELLVRLHLFLSAAAPSLLAPASRGSRAGASPPRRGRPSRIGRAFGRSFNAQCASAATVFPKRVPNRVLAEPSGSPRSLRSRGERLRSLTTTAAAALLPHGAAPILRDLRGRARAGARGRALFGAHRRAAIEEGHWGCGLRA